MIDHRPNTTVLALLTTLAFLTFPAEAALAWNESSKLTASDPAEDDHFGHSVSLSGSYAAIGARRDDNEHGRDAGSAYIFEHSGGCWPQAAKLTAGDGAAGDWFGYSVSLSGNYAIVGAPESYDNGQMTGAAYVFARSDGSWSEVARLIADDGGDYDYFGRDVFMDGDYAVVGALYDDDNGTNSGSAYIFQQSGGTWSQVAKLVASDNDRLDNFGCSVSLSDGYAIVGAINDDDHVDDSGSAYVFVIPEPSIFALLFMGAVGLLVWRFRK